MSKNTLSNGILYLLVYWFFLEIPQQYKGSLLCLLFLHYSFHFDFAGQCNTSRCCSMYGQVASLLKIVPNIHSFYLLKIYILKYHVPCHTTGSVCTSAPATLQVGTFIGNGIAGELDGTGQAAQLSGPNQLMWDSGSTVNGLLYATDQHCIRQITPDGVVTTYAGVATVRNNG